MLAGWSNLDWYCFSENKINRSGKRWMCAKRFRSKWTAECPPLLRGVWIPGGWGKDSAGSPDKAIVPTPPSPRPKRQGLGVACEDCNPGGLHSHDRAALGLLLLEGGREQIRLAGQVEQSFGQAAGGAWLGEGLQLVDAGHRCGAEHAVDAFLRGERWALQVSFHAQLLGHSRTLQYTWWMMNATVHNVLWYIFTVFYLHQGQHVVWISGRNARKLIKWLYN